MSRIVSPVTVGAPLMPTSIVPAGGAIPATAASAAAINSALQANGGVEIGTTSARARIGVVRFAPTVAELQTWSGTAFAIVALGVPGSIILPMWMTWESQISAVQSLSTTPTCSCRYATQPAQQISPTLVGAPSFTLGVYTFNAQYVLNGGTVLFVNAIGNLPNIVGANLVLWGGNNMVAGAGSVNFITVCYAIVTATAGV